MARYNLYINYVDETDGNYNEFFPSSFSPFGRKRDKGLYFTRYDWGEIEIANNPNLYAVASNPVYKLYDIISDDDFLYTQRILIRFVSEDTSETIEGYFSKNDCKFDDDRKIITVTPAIFDIYTDFLENREEEVDFSGYPLTASELAVSIPFTNKDDLTDWINFESSPDPYNQHIGSLIIKEKTFNPTSENDAHLYIPLANYFNIDESPNRDLINLTGNAFAGRDDGLTLQDREDVLEDTSSTIDKGDFELSSITIWVGVPLGLGGVNRQLWCSAVYHRELKKTADVGGSPVSPDGDGWTERDATSLNGEAAHWWTRKPFNGAYSDDWTLEDAIEEDGSFGGTYPYYWKQTTSLSYPDSDDSKTITTSIHLKDALSFLYNRTLPAISEDTEVSDSFSTEGEGNSTGTEHSIPFQIDTPRPTYKFSESTDVTVNTTENFFGGSEQERTLALVLNINGVMRIAGSGDPEQTIIINVYLDTVSPDPTEYTSELLKSFSAHDTPYSDGYATFSFFANNITKSAHLTGGQKLRIRTERDTFVGATTISYVGDGGATTLSISSTENTYENYGVVSTFLFNDLDDVAPISAYEGKNYVTNNTNELNNTKIFFTKDILETLGSDNTENLPKTTFKDFYDDLNKLFNGLLTWDIIDDDGGDNDKYLRIEHIKYIDLTFASTDIGNANLMSFINNFEFDKSEMFNLIELNQVNAGYKDFTENKITFNSIVSNNRNKDIKLERTTSKISTDLRYAIESSTDLSNGIILVVTDSAEENVLNKECQVSGQIEVNGYAAYSTLLITYCTYEGVWEEGWINGVGDDFKFEFDFTKRNKVGIELTLKGLENDIIYTTQIGDGLVDDGTVDFENETTNLKLRYRYKSESLIIFATDIYADFETYET